MTERQTLSLESHTVNISPALLVQMITSLPRLKGREINLRLLIGGGFPDSSVGKESTCNAGDPSLIPGSGRSPGEGIGYPFQYSWASLVAQLVKNPPAMQETWVQSLDSEDPLEKGKATHSSIVAWRMAWTVQTMESQRWHN